MEHQLLVISLYGHESNFKPSDSALEATRRKASFSNYLLGLGSVYA